MSSEPSNQLFKNYLRHYQESGSNLWQVSFEEVKALHLDRLPRWLGRIPHNAHILDGGCATGYMLGLLWKSGYRQLTGVELSDQLARIAESSLPEEINIINSEIQSFLKKAPSESFDTILFHHVLEHIPREHTIDLLREFHRCLKTSGHLSIKVPNASCLLAGKNMFGDFTHVTHFNENSLLQVLEEAGFKKSNLEVILHPPIIFWSWKHPSRALFRLLNRLRWSLHRIAHKATYILTAQHPIPHAFEAELEILVKKC